MSATSEPAEHWRGTFLTVWLGQSISLVGSMVVQFALIWWLTTTTGSALVLTLATLVGLLPTIFFSPIAGALVDRWERRKVLIFADGAIALTTFVLVVLAWLGILAPWEIYVALFFRSFFGAFHWPAMQASLSLMVPHIHLSRVKGMDSTLYGILRIASPPLGALLLTVLPLPWVLMTDVVTAAIAICTVLVCAIPQPSRDDAVQNVTAHLIWQDVRSGIRYLLSTPGLRTIIAAGALLNLLIVPFFTLLPIWVTRFYHGGAVELGWIESATGLGIIAGGVLLAVWGGFKKRIYTSLYGLAGTGVACILSSMLKSRQFSLAMLCVGVASMMQTLVQGPMLAVIQDVVPPELQGRVLTVLDSTTSLATPAGLVIAGLLGDARNPQVWFLVAGIGLIVLFVIGWLNPSVRNVEVDLKPQEVPVPTEVVIESH